jgi:signal transduction histidine kinase
MDTPALKILMLDDDEDELVLVKRLTARAHRRYAIDWTANPASALADMKAGGHDVYLVDYRLGNVSGLDIIREAVEGGVKAPLILLTATSTMDSDIDMEALRSGAADYLDKHALTPESLDRSIRYARERALSARLRERLGHAAFLAEASALLASSLDHQNVLQRMADLIVPKLADQCSVELDDCGVMRQVAFAPAPGARGPDTQATLSLPLTASGKTLGALTLVRERPYDENEVELMTELAHRAALAVENAQLYEDVRLAVQVRDDFLAIASHELKTPLAALLMHVQGLERSLDAQDAPRLKDRLAKAAASGLRLDALINQLLDVSHITAGRLLLDPEPLSIDQLVREVGGRFAEQASRARAPLQLRLDPGVMGCWDRARLDQIVSNLLSNAIKYGKGSPIEVVLERRSDEAVLRVIDHGIGIDPDQQRRIFERFERAVGTREYGGFGLGLWIVRRIVEAGCGHIEVESERGRGATFTVTIPLDLPKETHAARL